MQRPLAGLRVLDLTLALAGPLCTQRLGDMGAEIIKIEGPTRPDFTRSAPLRDMWLGGETTAYLALNRNKRSLGLDLKTAKGRAIFNTLVKTADVVIQNYRPGVAERLGISFSQLRLINPKIVYVSISGYGDTGPFVGRPGQDLLVQGFSGMTFLAGTREALPHPSPIYVVDVAASHHACEAILAAIIQRDRTGLAIEAKVSLLAAILEVQIQEVTTYLTTGRMAGRGGAPYASTWMEPPYGIYRTVDGYLAIAQASLSLIGDVLGSEDLRALASQRPASENESGMEEWRDAVYPLLAAVLSSLPTETTVSALSDAGVWCGPVQDYAALAEHPQAEGLFLTIDHPTAGAIRTLAPAIRFSTDPSPEVRPAPYLGQDTTAILAGLGISGDALEALRSEGVVA